MSQLGPLSRLVGKVAKIPHKGSFLIATSARLHEPSQLANKVIYNKNETICSRLQEFQIMQNLAKNGVRLCNLQPFTLSPLEAHLSALAVSKCSSLSTHEIRLPSLIKPVNITVPALNNSVMEMPAIPIESVISEPQIQQNSIEAPGQEKVKKQAARLIVIRKKKMRKHRLKKLRKKMKFVFLKRRQKREYLKEKKFQATEMAKVREFEAFSAEDYVSEILYRVNVKPTPHLWKGKKLPIPIIEDLMAKEKEKKEKRLEDKRYREEWNRKMEKKLEKCGYYDKEEEYMPLSQFLQLKKKL